MKNFQDLLVEIKACSNAREWAGDRNIEQVIEECHRGDWLIWLAARVNVDNRKLVLAAGKCAETVIHIMQDERSKAAVKAAIDYGEGRIGLDEVTYDDAADAAYAADAAAYAADAARAAYAASAARAASYSAYAARAASYSADAAAAYAARAASYSADATRAAAHAAAYAARAASYSADAAADAASKKQTANIVREVLGREILEKVNARLND